MFVSTYLFIKLNGSESNVILKSNDFTSISFFKKLAGRLASTITCTPMTIIPHMMGNPGLRLLILQWNAS